MYQTLATIIIALVRILQPEGIQAPETIAKHQVYLPYISSVGHQLNTIKQDTETVSAPAAEEDISERQPKYRHRHRVNPFERKGW